MKRKNIDLRKVRKLLNTVPDDTEVLSIELSENTYKIRVLYTYKEIERREYNLSLKELQKLLDEV